MIGGEGNFATEPLLSGNCPCLPYQADLLMLDPRAVFVFRHIKCPANSSSSSETVCCAGGWRLIFL